MGVYFVEGRIARQNGLFMVDNPYIDNTYESIEWDIKDLRVLVHPNFFIKNKFTSLFNLP